MLTSNWAKFFSACHWSGGQHGIVLGVGGEWESAGGLAREHGGEEI